MRIVLVISSLGAGGAERVIITLANHWAERGWAVTLITFERPDSTPYYPVDPRVSVKRLNLVAIEHRGQALLQSVRRIFALRRAIRSCEADVVISFLAKINIVTVLATRGMAVEVIVSERNNPQRQEFNPVWRWLRHRLYGVADRLVTPSKGVLTSLPAAVQARGQVIPNPVDLPQPGPRRDDGHTLVAAGRLSTQKGFDLLLQAFARIAGSLPEWRLVIWGEGPERSRLEALRDQLGLTDRVDLPGLTERPGQWVEDATVFVLSSRFESFGNVVTEAMAAGVPVITTDCPWGPGEIVDHGVDGWLVPPEDVDALAVGLATLMADGQLRARLAEAAQRSVRRFSRENAMAKWDALVCDMTHARHVQSACSDGRLAAQPPAAGPPAAGRASDYGSGDPCRVPSERVGPVLMHTPEAL